MSLFKKSKNAQILDQIINEWASIVNAHEDFLEYLGHKYNLDIMTEWKQFIAEWTKENWQ